MNNNDYIDVDYIDIKKEVFLTAPDVAREIPTDEKRVRYWGDTFGDIKECGVIKIDGRKKYTKQTIRAFKVIQKLIDEKQFSHAQVRDYVSKNGFEYITNNTNDLSKDLIGYNGLSSELSVEIEQRLNGFLEGLKTQILENNELLKSDIKEQVALTVDEVVSDKLDPFKIDLQNDIKQELKGYNDESKNSSNELKDQIQIGLDEIGKKLEKRDIDLVENLRESLKDEKIKALQAEIAELKSIQEQNQGFFSKLFNKKK